MEGVDGWPETLLKSLPIARGADAGGHGHVDDVGFVGGKGCAGIERVLEAGGEEYALLISEYVFGAVAVVDVEIDDGDSVHAVTIQSFGGADGDVVQEAKAHGAAALGVVPRWAAEAEGLLRRARFRELKGAAAGAGGVQRGLPGMLHHDGVEVDHVGFARFAEAAQVLEVLLIVDADEVLPFGGGCELRTHGLQETGAFKFGGDGLEARWAFGLLGPHVVKAVAGVAN